MKNKRKISTFFIVSISVVLAVIIFVGVIYLSEVSLNNNAKAELYYTFDGLDVHTNLSDEDSAEIVKMLNSKKKVANKGQVCDFNESIYISFHYGKKPKIFNFGCSDCPALHYKGKVVMLEEWEYDRLLSIVGEYGARMPLCERQ